MRCSRQRAGIPALPWAWPISPPSSSRTSCSFDAADPHWIDRDRFILSNGHGSMLLYSLFYLLGYKDMTLEELKRFRQVG